MTYTGRCGLPAGQPEPMEKDDSSCVLDILDGLRMETNIYHFSRLGSQWSVGVPPTPYSLLHVIRRGEGQCILPEQFSRWPLSDGDAILIPTGETHIISHDGLAEPVPLQDHLAASQPGGREIWRKGGLGPPKTELLCGIFEIRGIRHHPLFRYLPPALSLPKTEVGEWMEPLLDSVEQDYSSPTPGSFASLARVSELLFSTALAKWLSQTDNNNPWLGAFHDPYLGKALRAIHHQPGNDWTVSSLAKIAGVSRSSFASDFRTRLGVTPMAYVTNWRLWRAYLKLQDGDEDLSVLAGSTGFSCAASLTRAVRRHFGVPPSELRKNSVSQLGTVQVHSS